MVIVVTYVLLSLFAALFLLGVVAWLTKEPKVSRMAFIGSAVLFALSIAGITIDSL
jgi:hypothetical protein